MIKWIVLITSPIWVSILVYIVVKFATYAFFKGRNLARKEDSKYIDTRHL